MSFSDTFENRVLNWVFTASAVTRPTTWYVALFTAAPGETGGGTEVSTTSTGYARQAISFTVTGDTATNSAVIEFPAATASWGTVTSAAIFDASTGGNLIAYASALTASRTINTGDVFRFPASSVTVVLN